VSVLRFLWSPNVYWALWLVLAFGLREGIALGTGRASDTLSETTWRWFDVVPGKTLAQWSITHFLLLGFMAWLFGHLVFGIWRVWH
jgi:hypothetical protein